MNIGERIRWLRKQRNMTMAALGDAVGVTRQTISRYETSAIEDIPYEKIEKIAASLGVDGSYLLGLTFDSAMDAISFDLERMRKDLHTAKTMDEKKEIESAIAVLEESYEDAQIAQMLMKNASKADGTQHKNNIQEPPRSQTAWKSDKSAFLAFNIDSWLCWTLEKLAADSGNTLEDEIEMILYERVEQEIRLELGEKNH